MTYTEPDFVTRTNEAMAGPETPNGGQRFFYDLTPMGRERAMLRLGLEKGSTDA